MEIRFGVSAKPRTAPSGRHGVPAETAKGSPAFSRPDALETFNGDLRVQPQLEIALPDTELKIGPSLVLQVGLLRPYLCVAYAS